MLLLNHPKALTLSELSEIADSHLVQVLADEKGGRKGMVGPFSIMYSLEVTFIISAHTSLART